VGRPLLRNCSPLVLNGRGQPAGESSQTSCRPYTVMSSSPAAGLLAREYPAWRGSLSSLARRVPGWQAVVYYELRADKGPAGA
jgi:hypothetical protein